MHSIWKASANVNSSEESLRQAWYGKKKIIFYSFGVCRHSLRGGTWAVCGCISGCLHAHQEGWTWTHSASLAWVQTGSLLLMCLCRDTGDRMVSDEALCITAWVMRQGLWREKQNEGTDSRLNKMSGRKWVDILFPEWHRAPCRQKWQACSKKGNSPNAKSTQLDTDDVQ